MSKRKSAFALDNITACRCNIIKAGEHYEKTKPPSGIFFTCTEAQKRKIKSIVEKCNMGQGEYILKRALVYEPKTVLPDAFYLFHDNLCQILEAPPTPSVEKAALRVFDEIYAQLIDNRKQTSEEIAEENGA